MLTFFDSLPYTGKCEEPIIQSAISKDHRINFDELMPDQGLMIFQIEKNTISSNVLRALL